MAIDNFTGLLPGGTLVGSTQVVNSTDYYDDTARLYRTMVEFSFMVSE